MRLTPFRLTLLYVLAGALWIAFSDSALLALVPEERELSSLQTLKGLAFVGVTAALVYLLVRSYSRSMQALADSARAGHSLLQHVLDAAPVGIAIVGPAGNIVLANPAAGRIAGMRPDDTRDSARRLARFRDLAGAVVPYDRLPVSRVLATGEPSSGVEYVLERADGREVVLAIQAAPVRDDHGSVTGVVTAFADLTALRGAERARAEAERALHESERRYRLVAESVDDIIWTTDLEGRFTYVSPALRTKCGLDAQELVGTPLSDALTRASAATVGETVLATLARFAGGQDASGCTVELELACRPAGGLVTETRIGFLRDDHGAPLAMAGVSRDVTERRRLQAQLLQAQKMEAIGQLAGGVAHDFNNLLSVIQGYTTFVLRSLDPDSPARADVDEIARAAQRAADLTRQLLAVSRRSIGRPQVLDLNRVIGDLGTLLERTLGETVRIETALAPSLWMVRADQGQVEQVLVNLAVNARDAMPGGGAIRIETENVEITEASSSRYPGLSPGPYVLGRVRDEGTGMTPEVLARVFEPFFSTKEKDRSTGLGLSTVFGIVTQAGGNVYVDSEPDRGSTFSFLLPATYGAPSPRPARPAGARGGPETILVVEDDEAVRSVVCRLLRERGYGVVPACDGAGALAAAEGHRSPIDLVLTDVVMPGMSGAELVSRLRRGRPELKVVFMSGYASDDLTSAALASGRASWLHKPITGDALARRVREVLDGAA